MTKNNTIKLIFEIITGLLAYVIVGKFGLYLLQISWSDYAIHSTDKSYTLEMLLARQLVGILASISASICTVKVANDIGKSVWIVGFIVFCGGSYIHFMTITWTEYPPWYHFAYVLPIIPVTGLSHYLFAKRKQLIENRTQEEGL
jgi:uncharacterized membrane protein YgdD (TMEM256/DUF423 family)